MKRAINLASSFAWANRLPIWNRTLQFGAYRIDVPSFDRWLYVHLQLRQWIGNEDRTVFRRYVKPGMAVVDIGANIGLYTLLLAELAGPAGRVYAFEPDPLLFQAALTNIENNLKMSVVKAYQMAVGSTCGEGILCRAPLNSGDNRMDYALKHRTGVPVKITSLDGLLGRERVDFVKLDVQGWELKALRGMTRIISRNRDLYIYFEFWPRGLSQAGEDPRALIDFLHGHGFGVFGPDGQGPLSAENLQSHLKQKGTDYENLLARRA